METSILIASGHRPGTCPGAPPRTTASRPPPSRSTTTVDPVRGGRRASPPCRPTAFRRGREHHHRADSGATPTRSPAGSPYSITTPATGTARRLAGTLTQREPAEHEQARHDHTHLRAERDRRAGRASGPSRTKRCGEPRAEGAHAGGGPDRQPEPDRPQQQRVDERATRSRRAPASAPGIAPGRVMNAVAESPPSPRPAGSTARTG